MEVKKKNYIYDAPQVEVMELCVEGVLCASPTEGTEDQPWGN